MPVDDLRALAAAFLRPPRGQVLIALAEHWGATVPAVAERLGLSERRVRHQIDLLLAADLIEVVPGPGRARGYRLHADLRFDDADQLNPAMRAAVARDLLRVLLRDVSTAIAAGTFGSRPDDYAIRKFAEVDDECFADLAALHWSAYEKVGEAIRAGKERKAAAGGAAIEIVNALFFFEVPHWGDIASAQPHRYASSPAATGESTYLVPRGTGDSTAITAAWADPVRFRVLSALAERPGVSIREVSERIGEPPRRVRHQVEALLAAGLATVTGEELRPGFVERRFGAGQNVLEDFGSVDVETRGLLNRRILLLLIEDVAAAEAAEVDAIRARYRDEFEIRFYGEVDAACRDELAEIHRHTRLEIQATIETGQERLRASGKKGIEVVSAFFSFEAPIWRGL